MKNKTGLYKIIFGLFFLLFQTVSHAQCAMCRAALANDENIKQAEAVNDGIIFLMVIPYLLVALVGFGVYKIKYAKK
ncbi:MAG TPA: hypothetical protein DDZ41_06420 [Flavobacterium sp.]|nr:hypothetical protein [Flavobacterium sp.]